MDSMEPLHGAGVCDPHMNGLSLQEMIDTDIKADFDDVLLHSSAEGFTNMDTLDGLLGDSDFKLEDMGSGGCGGGMGGASSSLGNWGNFNPGALSYLEDFPHGSNIMVNPANVMPVTTASQQQQQQSSMISPGGAPGGGLVNSQAPQQQQPAVIGNLSINTQQFSNVQQQAIHSPALSSPAATVTAYSQQQQLQQLSPIIQPQQQTYQQHSAAAGGATAVQLRPQSHQQQHIVRPTSVLNVTGVATGHNNVSKTVKVLPPNSSPMQQVPNLTGHQHSTIQTVTLQAAGQHGAGGHQLVGQLHQQQQPAATVIQSSSQVVNTGNTNRKKSQQQQSKQQLAEKENGYPKPGYSYSCLIALALKNSHTGHLSVSEIYKFMCEHFPYFRTAPAGWKNSVRHNLSLNKCFEKIERPAVGGAANQRKGCLWAMNPAKINKMDGEVLKWSRKDPMAIKKGMVHPHTLEKLERGEMIKDYNANTTGSGGGGAGGGAGNGAESEDEDDPKSPTSISSQSSSQGYDSAGSDFVDIGGFASIPDSSLPELQLQASGNIFEELADERLQFTPVPAVSSSAPPPQPAAAQQPQPAAAQVITHSTISSSGAPVGGGLQQHHIYTSSSGGGQQQQQHVQHQQIVRLAAAVPQQQHHHVTGIQQQRAPNNGFYPTAIHANYAIAPAAAAASATATSTSGAIGVVGANGSLIKRQQTLVVTRQEGSQEVFTVGGPITS